MLDVLIDNIFVLLGGQVFQQTIGIPMDTNRALRYSPICFYMLMRYASFKGFSRIKMKN
jgi:hypothetical protein